MNDFAGNTVQLASVWLVATVVTSTLSAVFYPLFRRAISGNHPATRSLVTLGYALIAPAAGVVTALVTLFPGMAELVTVEHCHAGACGTHAPLVADGSLGGFGLLVAASLIAVLAGSAALRAAVYGGRRLRSLFALSRHSRDREHLVLDSHYLFAWCCGFFRQRIVLSRALLDRLSAAELNVVLAHERTHLSRFDNLRNLAARCATTIWPPGPRARLRADLETDSELVCDIAALKACSSQRLFQRVVELMSPGTRHAPLGTAATFGCNDAAARIGSLSQVGSRQSALPALSLLAALWILKLAAAAFVSHPVVEVIATLGV